VWNEKGRGKGAKKDGDVGTEGRRYEVADAGDDATRLSQEGEKGQKGKEEKHDMLRRKHDERKGGKNGRGRHGGEEKGADARSEGRVGEVTRRRRDSTSEGDAARKKRITRKE
jgi:hypothetical protein